MILGVVAGVADRVAVMYAGKIVEIGTAEEIFYDPKASVYMGAAAVSSDFVQGERMDSPTITGNASEP